MNLIKRILYYHLFIAYSYFRQKGEHDPIWPASFLTSWAALIICMPFTIQLFKSYDLNEMFIPFMMIPPVSIYWYLERTKFHWIKWCVRKSRQDPTLPNQAGKIAIMFSPLSLFILYIVLSHKLGW